MVRNIVIQHEAVAAIVIFDGSSVSAEFGRVLESSSALLDYVQKL